MEFASIAALCSFVMICVKMYEFFISLAVFEIVRLSFENLRELYSRDKDRGFRGERCLLIRRLYCEIWSRLFCSYHAGIILLQALCMVRWIKVKVVRCELACGIQVMVLLT